MPEADFPRLADDNLIEGHLRYAVNVRRTPDRLVRIETHAHTLYLSPDEAEELAQAILAATL